MNKKLVRAFVVAQCLEQIGSAWFFATYGLFLVSIGLSEMEFVGVSVVFMVVKALIDPPTGNLGDRFGQKKVYMVGLLLWALGIGVYGFANSFLVCVLAEMISGIGSAFRSEALESWLKNRVDEETMLIAQSEAKFFSKLAVIPTAILGGVVAGIFGLQWPWFLGGITLLFAVAMTWYLLREFGDVFEHETGDVELNLWTIAKRAWSNVAMRKIFILVAIMSACFMPINMYWSRVFAASGGSVSWMGSVWIGIAGLGALGSKLAKKLKISSTTIALIVTSIGFPLIFPQFLTTHLTLLVATFLLHEIGRGTIHPILWGYFNRRVNNKSRTTENSLRSTAEGMGAVVGLVISGVLTNWFSLTQIWAVAAIALLISAIWVTKWNHD